MNPSDEGPVRVGGGAQTAHLAHRGCLAALFCHLAKERFTGVVYAECKTGGGVFSLREGRAVFFEDVREGQSVADDLLEQRLITKPQYADIAAEVVNASAESEDVAFCQQAVRFGVLQQAQVDAEFERRVRQRLVQAVGWQDCRIEVDSDPESLMGILEYPQEIGPLVYMGVRTFFDEERIAPLVPPGNDVFVRLLAAEPEIVALFGLDEREAALLCRLRPETKLGDIMNQAGADVVEARQFVCALVLAGLIELASAPFSRATRQGIERSTETRNSPAGRYTSASEVREERLGRPPASRAAPAHEAFEPSRPVGRSAASKPNHDAPRGAESRTALAREERAGPLPRQRAPSSKQRSVATPAPAPPAGSASGSLGSKARPASGPLASKARPASGPLGSKADPASRPAADAAKHSEDRAPARAGSGPVQSDSGDDRSQSALHPEPNPGRPSREWRRPRMLGAALKRLDRELKQRRPAQTPAVVATAAPVEAAAAAAVPGRSHVESLMRMRREALDQRKRDDEGKTTASNVGVEAYRSAQEALRAQKFTRAHEFMQKALAADPNNAIYLMYQKWAAFRSNLLDEEGVSKLRAELREKVSDDLHRAFAYYALGHIALADKKDEAAERFFARAVELDKENKDAERHMRILELRRKNVDQDRQKKIFGIEVGKRS